MRESQVERLTVKKAAEHGIKARKMSGANDNGFPDHMFWRKQADGKPKVVFIEFKRPGETPTDLQTKRMEELRADGFVVEDFDNMPLALRFLKQHLL